MPPTSEETITRNIATNLQHSPVEVTPEEISAFAALFETGIDVEAVGPPDAG